MNDTPFRNSPPTCTPRYFATPSMRRRLPAKTPTEERGLIVTITGDAGAGKTQLARAIALCLERDGYTVAGAWEATAGAANPHQVQIEVGTGLPHPEWLREVFIYVDN